MTLNNTFINNLDIKKRISKVSFYLVALFAFLMPLSSYFGKKALILLFLIWIFTTDYKKVFHLIVYNNFIRAITLLILFSSLSILWSDNQILALRLIEVLLIYFYIPTIMIYSIIKKEHIPILIYSFLSSMFLNTIFSFLMYFSVSDNIFGLYFGGTPLNLVPFQTSHMTYSAYLAFSFFLVLNIFINNKSFFIKCFTFLFANSLLFVLFSSTGRTGQLVFLVTTLILVLYYFRKKVKYLLISFILLNIIFIGAYSSISTFKSRINSGVSDINKVIKHHNYSSSFGVRMLSYVLIPELIEENNSIIGTGISDSQEIVNKKHLKILKNGHEKQKGQLHNTYLTILLSLGIIGLLLFLNLIISILRTKTYDSNILFIKYIFLSTFLISALSTEIFGQKELMFLFALFASISCVDTNNKELT